MRTHIFFSQLLDGEFESRDRVLQNTLLHAFSLNLLQILQVEMYIFSLFLYKSDGCQGLEN